MSASPCRDDLFANQSQEASWEKMQSSFSRSHTSLTETRQTQNHIHISDAAVTMQKQVQEFYPSFLALFLPGHSYSTIKVAHSWKWSTLLLGAFPICWCIFQKNFLRNLFLMRIDQDTDKSQGSTKLLQKHSEKGRQDHWVRPWAPMPQSHDLKRWNSYCCLFSWQHWGWKRKSG